jgi:uncharacterized protein YqgQ
MRMREFIFMLQNLHTIEVMRDELKKIHSRDFCDAKHQES